MLWFVLTQIKKIFANFYIYFSLRIQDKPNLNKSSCFVFVFQQFLDVISIPYVVYSVLW